MRSSAILCGLVLALVVVLVLLGRPRAPAAGEVSVGEGASSVSVRAPTSGDRTPDIEADTSSSSPSGAGQRDAVEPSSHGPTCRIRVVEARSKAAVADARVWIQREDVEFDSAAWSRAMRRSNDVEQALQSGLGNELVLDERAEAFVPCPAHARLVAAARGELHGDAMLEPGKAECVVEMKPYHALTVEVVDRAGRPVAGALVALYSGEFDPLEDTSTWIADDAGRVWIPRLESQIGSASYAGPIRVSLAAGVRGEPEVVLFTPGTTPAEPVRLVAGDFGRLVLQLVDSRGQELALDGRADIDMVDELVEDRTVALRAGSDIDMPLSSGRAVFASVGLDMTFEVMIAAEGYASVWREVPGPREAGQELCVLVPVGDRLVRARGRVHGLSACFGDPAPRVVLTGNSTNPGNGTLWAHVEEGQEFDRPVQYVSDVRRLVDPWVFELAYGKTSARATALPVLDEAAGVADFGDISFEPLPELARVRVCDDSGAAVPYAGVEIESLGGERQRWCDEAGLGLVTGPLTELPMRIRATHRAWLPSEWTRVDSAGSETALVVRRGASIRGRLLLPRGARPDDFEVRLRIEPSTPGSEAQVAVAELVEEGRFRLAPCEAGRATLTVYNDGPAVLERPAFELAPGQALELEPIDLREVLHPFALTFELASGEPWIGGHLEVRDPDGQLSTWRTIGRSARASLLSLRSSVDLWVAGLGARATLFENVLDGDRLTLPPAPSVRLRLSPGVRRPDPPLALMVRGTSSAETEFETYEDVDTEAAVVGEDGTAWLRVSRPGSYELHCFVRHTGTGVEYTVEQAQPQTVEVPDGPAIPVVEASLGPDEVERAVRAAGG